MALLFTAYGGGGGEELWGKTARGRGGLRLGRVWLYVVFGGLNLTPDSGRLKNNHRLDSEVKQPSVGICFCLLSNHGVSL